MVRVEGKFRLNIREPGMTKDLEIYFTSDIRRIFWKLLSGTVTKVRKQGRL